MKHLHPESVVYSLGVGDTIGFDLQVIKQVRATVHAFDPTPHAIGLIERQHLPPQFIFHQWAVGSDDGTLFMTKRANRTGMWTAVAQPTGEEEVIEVPCFSLQSIMRQLDHSKIDLLKMDVEGSEYEILRDVVDMPNKPVQLLVEFHHRFPEIGQQKTLDSIRALRAVGYKVFAVSETGREISFIHASAF